VSARRRRRDRWRPRHLRRAAAAVARLVVEGEEETGRETRAHAGWWRVNGCRKQGVGLFGPGGADPYETSPGPLPFTHFFSKFNYFSLFRFLFLLVSYIYSFYMRHWQWSVKYWFQILLSSSDHIYCSTESKKYFTKDEYYLLSFEIEILLHGTRTIPLTWNILLA